MAARPKLGPGVEKLERELHESLARPKTGESVEKSEADKPAPRGVGGRYHIGEDGVRRKVKD